MRLLALLLATGLLLGACGGAAGTYPTAVIEGTPDVLATLPPSVEALVPKTCTARGPLPDQICTPGTINPTVTQANIKETICKSGWTTTVRPPQSYTGPLKIAQMRSYGFTGATSAYEEDHYIPLELGGHPSDPRNLWPEAAAPTPGFHQKDLIENKLKALVCSGKITLADAQRRIAADWTKALP